MPNETKAPSKIDQVIALLHRKQGASVAEISGATNWLHHTTRAALTGLRKKGHVLTKEKENGITRHSIASGKGK